MALVGLHVLAGYAGNRGYKDSVSSLMNKRIWSETLEEPGRTSNVAPRSNDVSGHPVFQLRCGVNAWVAIGQNPSASTSPRLYLPADETVDHFCEPGDAVDWEPVE